MVQTALQGLSTVGSDNAIVSGNAGGPFTVHFQGSLAGGTDILSGDGSGLTGGLFSITQPPQGLYDVLVINPDGDQAILPYRFLLTQTVEPEVTVGVGGPRYIFAGATGTYSVTLANLGNIDAPYTYFSVGIPEMGTNMALYNLPYLYMESNVAGGPSMGTDQNLAWATLNSINNLNGENLTTGYLVDEPAAASADFTFNVDTYPGLAAMEDRSWSSFVAALCLGGLPARGHQCLGGWPAGPRQDLAGPDRALGRVRRSAADVSLAGGAVPVQHRGVGHLDDA